MATIDDAPVIVPRVPERELTDSRWEAHAREHELIALALASSLADHRREHAFHEQAHDREHQMNETALAKASDALEKRIHGINEFRSQLRDQADRLATQEALDTLRSESDRRFAETIKRTDERFESNRHRIEVLEKGDVKAEGRGLGQTATVAWIVTGLTIASVVIGIVLSALKVAG